MNKKQTFAFTMLAMVFGVAASPVISADNAEARIFPSKYVLHGDLTAPSNDKPFGGERVGKYYIETRAGFTTISTSLEKRASEGMIFEGWLVDVETGEKLSTGTTDGDIIRGHTFSLLNKYHKIRFQGIHETVIYMENGKS